MAQTGKKINELTQISTVTDETVLPGVYVNSGVADSTANKISVQQLSAKVQNDMSSALSAKQDKLTAGDNITIESNVISATDTKYTAGTNITISEQNVISADVDALPSQSGNSGKFLTTNGTTASWATVQAGGGAPTLTWYTGNTGSTVTIADTSAATLVKIYKNGILLEPTADYSISGTTLTLVTALVSTDKVTTEVF